MGPQSFTAVARLPLRQLGFLVKLYTFITALLVRDVLNH